MPDAVRILVVDDEPLARQRVLDLLEGRSDLEVVGTAGTGRKAVEAIRSLSPDVVFLDVQMPGLTGLEVAKAIGSGAMPITVFVTAYDQHALEAFDVAAVDYLLKPFDDDRFEVALSRALEAARSRTGSLSEQLSVLLSAAQPSSRTFLERVAVEMRGQTRFVPVLEVDYFVSDGPYVEVHVGDATHVVRERLQSLEDRLDPARFFRVHRSTIVQIDRVEALLTAPGGDYAVRLHDGTRLSLSRSRREAFEARLGV